MPDFEIEIEEGTKAPNFQKMMLANVRALRALNGKGHIYAIADKVVELGLINPDQQSYMMPNDETTKLKYYLGWGRTYLRYAGALESVTRGTWALTAAGTQIDTLQHAQDAYSKYTEILAQRNAQEQDEAVEEELDLEEETDPDDAVWKNPLLNILKAMEYDAFERLCHNLLETAGFIDVNVNFKKGADGGVDGVGFWRDNLLSRKIYFQCKRWRDNPVRSKHIRDFRGALHGRTNQGLFITTSRFTAPAKDEAIRDGSILIDLIDGNKLCDLLKEKNLGFQEDNAEIPNPDYFNNI